MAKNFNPRTAESLFKQKLRTMIGSTAHTQNIADQAMELAGQFMTEDEISQLGCLPGDRECELCVCEEAMQVLVEELQKGTRLHEILTGD